MRCSHMNSILSRLWVPASSRLCPGKANGCAFQVPPVDYTSLRLHAFLHVQNQRQTPEMFNKSEFKCPNTSPLEVLCFDVTICREMTMAAPKTILVIGGGLGGLAFAQILRHSAVADVYRVVILERDATPTHRGQGYQIAVNVSGLASISSIPHIASVLDTGEKEYTASMVDGDLNPMLQWKHETGLEGFAGLVNRWKLRSALAEGLEVQWGKRFVRYEEFGSHVVAYFDDGSEVRGDLLIGADGAKSRVRAQRCPELQLQKFPDVVKVAGFITVTPRVREQMPKLVELTEQSQLTRALAGGGNTVMVMQHESEDGETRLIWSLSFPAPSSTLDLTSDPSELKQAIDSRAAVFGKELAALIHETALDDYAFKGKISAIAPVKGNPLGRTSRVTLLGDAAHAMTTHRGLGANTAFADAFDLAQALACVEDPWRALAEYEEKMIHRGFRAIESSVQSFHMVHLVGVKSVIRDVMIRALGWAFWAKRLVLG